MSPMIRNRPSVPRRLVPILMPVLTIAAGLAGCSADQDVAVVRSESTQDATDTDGTGSTAPDAPIDSSPFGWTQIGDGLQQGSLEVPIDVDDPGAGSFTLHLVRHRRPARRG